MSSLESRLGAPGRTRRSTAGPAPALFADGAVDVVAFFIWTPLKIVALNFRGLATAAGGHCTTVGAALEAHQIPPAAVANIV